MSKYFITVFLLIVSAGHLCAQDNMIDDLEFEEIEIVEERPTYFAIGGGYIGNFYFINFDEINKKLENDFQLSTGYSGTMFVDGVHGFTGVGIIPNLRIGFFGSGGSMDISNDSAEILNGSKLAVSLTGLTIDYGFVLFKHFALLPGIQAGWSSINLDIYRTQNTTWDNISSEGNGSFYSKNIAGSFWFVQPTLQLEYALTPFLMARGQVGYNLSFKSPFDNKQWTYNTSAELTGVPNSISTSSFNFGFGISVGLFNF